MYTHLCLFSLLTHDNSPTCLDYFHLCDPDVHQQMIRLLEFTLKKRTKIGFVYVYVWGIHKGTSFQNVES